MLGRALFPEILGEELPEGVRTVLRRDPTRVREVPVADEGVRIDIDDPAVLRRHFPNALEDR